MKKKFKKTLSLVLAVLMVMTVVPFGVFATECTNHVYTVPFYSGDGYHYFKCECGARNLATAEDCDGDKTNAKCGEYKVCTVCEGEYKFVEHTFTERTATADFIATQGTCKAKKTYYFNCINAGCNAKGTETFEGTEYGTHVWSAGVSDGNAGCLTDGTKKVTCNVDGCGEEATVADAGSALGHDYSEKVKNADHVKTAGTCETATVYYYNCSRCDANAKNEENNENLTYTDNASIGVHFFVQPAMPADLDKELKSAATCTKLAVFYKVCKDCLKSAKELKTETNSYENETYEYGVLAAHNYGNVVKKEYCIAKATCSEAAIYTKSCINEGCGKKAYDNPNNLPSTDDGLKINIEGDPGSVAPYNAFRWNGEVDIDGDGKNDPEYGKALKHSKTKMTKEAKDPTCTLDGNEAEYTCEYCGTITVEEKKINKLGHDFSDGLTKTYKAPTCTEDGEFGEIKCKRCETSFYVNEKGETMSMDNIGSFIFNSLEKYGHVDDDDDTFCDRVLKDENGKDKVCGSHVTPEDLCNCLCHADGFMYFIGWLLKWFWSITGTRQFCECGAMHY